MPNLPNMDRWRARQVEQLKEKIAQYKPKKPHSSIGRVNALRAKTHAEMERSEKTARDTAKALDFNKLIYGEYESDWSDPVKIMFARGETDAYEVIINWIDRHNQEGRPRLAEELIKMIDCETADIEERRTFLKSEIIESPAFKGRIEELIETDGKLAALRNMNAWIQGFSSDWAMITYNRAKKRLAQHEKKAKQA